MRVQDADVSVGNCSHIRGISLCYPQPANKGGKRMTKTIEDILGELWWAGWNSSDSQEKELEGMKVYDVEEALSAIEELLVKK